MSPPQLTCTSRMKLSSPLPRKSSGFYPPPLRHQTLTIALRSGGPRCIETSGSSWLNDVASDECTSLIERLATDFHHGLRYIFQARAVVKYDDRDWKRIRRQNTRQRYRLRIVRSKGAVMSDRIDVDSRANVESLECEGSLSPLVDVSTCWVFAVSVRAGMDVGNSTWIFPAVLPSSTSRNFPSSVPSSNPSTIFLIIVPSILPSEWQSARSNDLPTILPGVAPSRDRL